MGRWTTGLLRSISLPPVGRKRLEEKIPIIPYSDNSSDDTSEDGRSSLETVVNDSSAARLFLSKLELNTSGLTRPLQNVRLLDAIKPVRRCSMTVLYIITIIIATFLIFLVAGIRYKHGLPLPPSQEQLLIKSWQSFPLLYRYYGGINSLIPAADNKPESQNYQNKTIPEDNSQTNLTAIYESHLNSSRSSTIKTAPYRPTDPRVKQCFVDAEEQVKIPSIRAYQGVVDGMPKAPLGSYEVMGLDEGICMDRYSRFAAYGYGYSKNQGGSDAGLNEPLRIEALADTWGDQKFIDYPKIKWHDMYQRCLKKNINLFNSTDKNVRPPKERTAILIRTWTGYEYDQEDILHFRAMINELSIETGGEYQIFFLIHVKDDTGLPIWGDETANRVYADSLLPEEFKGMGVLWSEYQMKYVYGHRSSPPFGADYHNVYRSSFMPIQYFSHQHPEFDYFYNWEIDIRYIGHLYHFFKKTETWAAQQPRKGLWERNDRFYIPEEYGTWEEFTKTVDIQTNQGTRFTEKSHNKMFAGTRNPDQDPPAKPIWGPERPGDDADWFEIHNDCEPPTSYDEDNYEWGVGEPADLISYFPTFDPTSTHWNLRDDITGYNLTDGYPPRRTVINASGRLSRRLLKVMHRETLFRGHSAFTEMWPPTTALHHGFKAVTVPHPVHYDRLWPSDYMSSMFNNGKNGGSGGTEDSIFQDSRQPHFRGSTWFYNAEWASELMKRWLGYEVNGQGGLVQEANGEGRMCLPGILFHPIKQMDLKYGKTRVKDEL